MPFFFEVEMRYPFVICSGDTLIIAPAGFFERIGRVDPEAGILEMNVKRDGKAGFKWLLDADGLFYELSSIGLMPPNFLQRIGLKRAREKFRIMPGRRITAGDVSDRVANLHNQFEEAPNVTDLKSLLNSLKPEHVLGAEEMSRYL